MSEMMLYSFKKLVGVVCQQPKLVLSVWVLWVAL